MAVVFKVSMHKENDLNVEIPAGNVIYAVWQTADRVVFAIGPAELQAEMVTQE
jgi:hypothetical protein